MNPTNQARAVFLIGLIICVLPLLAEARGGRHGGGSVEGPGAFLIGGPMYWFAARHYLDKISHQFVAACVLLLILAALGPLSLVAGCLGVAATYFMGWPFLLPSDHIDSGFHSTLILVNLFATVAAAVLGLGTLAKYVPLHW